MRYRILSLDGGGSWALIQVRALIALYGEGMRGNDVLREFDMVAANSGGSLVLGGLLEDLTLGDLLGYFEDETKRKAVFSPTRAWGDRLLRSLAGMGPKYSAHAKLPALQQLLPRRGNVTMANVASGLRRGGAAKDVHLLIVSYDYDRNRSRFFRSTPTTNANVACWGAGGVTDVTLAEAIHASTNAPVNYFDGPATFPDRPGRYWDGAITGCNNPILASVTEALVMEATDIVALSLGTATVMLPSRPPQAPDSPLWQEPTAQSLVNDLGKLATAILDDPPDVATFHSHVMLGGCAGLAGDIKSRIVRMNPLISPIRDQQGNWTPPGGMAAAQFLYLANLEMDAVEQHDVDRITAYANLWLANEAHNQPIRMNSQTLECELGYPWFRDAVDAWHRISAPS